MTQPGSSGDTAKKAAIGTVTVIGVLIGLFCVLPTALCLILGAIGTITTPSH